MVQQDDSDNPWSFEALQQNPASDDVPYLTIETIEGVEPLDDQFGVHPPKTVPEALYEPLFGQPEPTEAEIAAAGGNPQNVPPMQTYAILDAAKVFGLPEMLAHSGLEHRCLFKGDAYDEMKDVAPWIVRLEEGNYFTQKLFTEGEPSWFMWNKEPGIYVRSHADLDTLWRHFRKFTKLQDESGKWFYFRFWEQKSAAVYFKAIQPNFQRVASWFFIKKQMTIAALIVLDVKKYGCHVFQVKNLKGVVDTPTVAFQIGTPERSALQHARMEADIAELSSLLRQSFPEKASKICAEDMDKAVRKSASRIRDFGITQRDNMFRLLAWDLHTDGAFEREDPDGHLRKILEMDIPENDKMRRLTERLSDLEE